MVVGGLGWALFRTTTAGLKPQPERLAQFMAMYSSRSFSRCSVIAVSSSLGICRFGLPCSRSTDEPKKPSPRPAAAAAGSGVGAGPARSLWEGMSVGGR